VFPSCCHLLPASQLNSRAIFIQENSISVFRSLSFQQDLFSVIYRFAAVLFNR
jgi:hypothetical protein